MRMSQEEKKTTPNDTKECEHNEIIERFNIHRKDNELEWTPFGVKWLTNRAEWRRETKSQANLTQSRTQLNH